MSRALAWLGTGAIIFAVGCGSSSPPAGPSPPMPGPSVSGPVPDAPAEVRLATIDSRQRTATIEWNPSTGADGYVVEYWKLYDPSVTITTIVVDASSTSATIREVPGDVLSVGVRGRNANGVGPRSRPILLQILDLKDIVEALFFGSGPYGTGLFSTAPGGFIVEPPEPLQQHVQSGRMLGWASGRIPVRVEDSISDDLFAKLNVSLAHLADLTGHDIQPVVVERGAGISAIEPGELHILIRDDVSICGPPPVDGCASQHVVDGGRMTAASIYLKRSLGIEALLHELGHALLGLHHVWHLQGETKPVMSPSGGPSDGTFSAIEIEAIRSVFRAGLRFGATRDDFRQRALIN